MKRQELSANRQVVQSAVLVRGRSGGTDPSAGPRRLGRALIAVHLLPREKEDIVLGGRDAPENGLFKFSLHGCGSASGGWGGKNVGGKGRRRALGFSGGSKLAVPWPGEALGTANAKGSGSSLVQPRGANAPKGLECWDLRALGSRGDYLSARNCGKVSKLRGIL
jgi:hypothetical protein